MPSIQLQQWEAPLTYTSTAVTTLPLDVYTAWAAALGVSATETLQPLDDDDEGFAVTLAASPWPGSTATTALVSSEGGLGLYRLTPSTTTSAQWTLSGVSRFYGLTSRPTLVLTCHPASDLRSVSGRIQRAGAVTIVYIEHQKYDAATYQYRLALRIEPGQVTLVGQTVDQACNITLFELTEPATTTTVRQSATLQAQAAGNIHRIEIAIAGPTCDARGRLASPLVPAAGLIAVDGAAWGALASPLASSTALVAPNVDARGRLRSPLRPRQGVARTGAVGWSALASPLGAGAGLAQVQVVARAAFPSPLGRPAALAITVLGGVARLPSPLTAVRGLLWIPATARAHCTSPLGRITARAAQPRPAIAAAVLRPARRLFADPLPLRDGADLPDYPATGPLPWVYGRVTLTPIPWDTAGLAWLVADHPIVGVTGVRDDGVTVGGWELVQTLDTTGTPIALLRLTRAPQGTLAVDVLGRRDDRTGALLEAPSDVATDVLTRCGHVVGAGTWSALARSAPGVRLGGVIDQAVTLRAALTAVIGAVGARWSAAPLRAWWPTGGATVATITPALADRVAASADTGSLATRIRVPWGWDWAAQAPRGTVILEAPEALRRYGRIETELAAPWLRTARDALALATTALEDAARPQWQVEVTLGPGPRWAPGDRVLLAHPWLPAGLATITQTRWTAGERVLVATLPAGPVPRVVTIGTHALAEAAAADPLQITYRDGIATFIITDDAGRALAGAAVTLDGQQTEFTDRLGRVQFVTGRGVHTLRVVAAGYATMDMEVQV